MVFISEIKDEDGGGDYVVYRAKNVQGAWKILFSTSSKRAKSTKTKDRNFLQKHFNLANAPELSRAAGIA